MCTGCSRVALGVMTTYFNILFSNVVWRPQWENIVHGRSGQGHIVTFLLSAVTSWNRRRSIYPWQFAEVFYFVDVWYFCSLENGGMLVSGFVQRYVLYFFPLMINRTELWIVNRRQFTRHHDIVSVNLGKNRDFVDIMGDYLFIYSFIHLFVN
jgi:hypothetical protein